MPRGPHSCGRRSGLESSVGADKRGLNSKLHLAVDAYGMPVRILLTSGSAADCTQAGSLIAGLIVADRGDDGDEIVEQATQKGMSVVIAPRKNRKVPRQYDSALYRHRHLVENAFLQLKRWRGIATPYTKNTAAFLAAAQIRYIAIWTRILGAVHIC